MDRIRVFVSPRTRRRTILVGGAVVLILGAASLLLAQFLPDLSDPAAIRAYVLGFGPLAPLAFVALQAAQVIFAPIPGQVVAIAGGYLFGAVAGTAYSLLGAGIGSYVVFRLSRHFGRPYVEDVVVSDLLDRFDAVVERRGYLALFLVFLVPGLPDDAICFAAGLTELDVKRMVAVSIVGRAPAYLLVNLAGESLAVGRFTDAILIVCGILLVSAVVYLRRDWLLDRLGAENG